ncbi:MAG: VOC family protein [Gammaproteobacteria bacterium]|nr:VOC family protein [Gammaproteobacteria bacterium]
MQIQSIHHVSLIVNDTNRALKFYCDVLGLPQAERPDLGFPGAWLQVGEVQQIHLLELENPYARVELPEHGGRDRHAAFSITELDALAERLATEGVAYRMSSSGRMALFCRDPDGNTLEFIESRPGPQ